MKTTSTLAAAFLIGGATPALAATEMAEGFSGVFLWVFIGYCSIIVVAQSIVGIRALFNHSGKGVAEAQPEQQEV